MATTSTEQVVQRKFAPLDPLALVQLTMEQVNNLVTLLELVMDHAQ